VRASESVRSEQHGLWHHPPTAQARSCAGRHRPSTTRTCTATVHAATASCASPAKVRESTQRYSFDSSSSVPRTGGYHWAAAAAADAVRACVVRSVCLGCRVGTNRCWRGFESVEGARHGRRLASGGTAQHRAHQRHNTRAPATPLLHRRLRQQRPPCRGRHRRQQRPQPRRRRPLLLLLLPLLLLPLLLLLLLLLLQACWGRPGPVGRAGS
jgi:hypothetical protein